MIMTEEQRLKATTFMPTVTALFSIFGSAGIICEVIRKFRERKDKVSTYHRIMLMMSFCDVCASVGWASSRFVTPADPALPYTYGNDATCNAQAYMFQIGMGVPCYCLCQSVYFYLLCVKHTKDARIVYWERFMHAFSLLFGFGTATAGLALDLYGFATFWCWITTDQNAYRWAFYYGPLWAIIVAVIVVMAMLVRGVTRQVARSQAYTFTSSSATVAKASAKRTIATNKKIVETKKKALLYAGSLIFTFFFLTITRILQAVGAKSPFWLKFLAVGLVPSQGAINYFIYKRPVSSYRKYREQNPEKSIFMAILSVVPVFSLLVSRTGGLISVVHTAQTAQTQQ